MEAAAGVLLERLNLFIPPTRRVRGLRMGEQQLVEVAKALSLNGNIQPTKNWSFNFNASYDFDAGKIAYMSCNLTRNLHCWSISASFNPVGQYKSYYVSLRASSSMLQDLKYEQRGRASSYDPNWD